VLRIVIPHLVVAAAKLAARVMRTLRNACRPSSVTGGVIADLTRSRAELIAENVLLRQQLIVASRGVKRPGFRGYERGLLVLLARFLPRWPDALLLVKPETVLRWHRAGFRLFWPSWLLPGSARDSGFRRYPCAPKADEIAVPWQQIDFAYATAIRTRLAERYAPATSNRVLASMTRLEALLRLSFLQVELRRISYAGLGMSSKTVSPSSQILRTRFTRSCSPRRTTTAARMTRSCSSR
jgi:hypothetical protein